MIDLRNLSSPEESIAILSHPFTGMLVHSYASTGEDRIYSS